MKMKIMAPVLILLGAGLAVLALQYTDIFNWEKEEETLELTEAQMGMFLDLERKVKAVRQSVQNGILAQDEDFLIQASNQSLEVFDLIDSLTDTFQEAEGLEEAYQDFYASLVSIITLFLENRLEPGRARLMEMEESHAFIDNKLRGIVATVTGEGCLPCFQDL